MEVVAGKVVIGEKEGHCPRTNGKKKRKTEKKNFNH